MMGTRYTLQNFAIMVILQTTMLSLLWISSFESNGYVVSLCAITFSFLGLTNYALIHEGCHNNLHVSNKSNQLMGMMCGWLFPVSFTFMEICHGVHHRNNRTDNELFDYYYPTDNLFIKYTQWYGILLGLYPPFIPLGSLLMAFVPKIFWLRPWQQAKSSSIIFQKNFFTKEIIHKIRLEVAGGIIYWTLLYWILDLKLTSIVILYFAFWFNWSTRQYVTHAFSERHITNGAWNLKVGTVMDWIFLHGQWDLVHHNYPNAPWQELPKIGEKSNKPIPYWQQYFRQWLGPRPNFQSAPKPNEV